MHSALASLVVDECEHDTARVAIPRTEVQVIVRFGPSARNGIDAHAFGPQPKVRRKTICAGQRAVIARLHPGTSAAVFGVPACALAGEIVALEAFWSESEMQRFYDHLIVTRSTVEAALVVESAIAERFVNASTSPIFSPLAMMATARLTSTSVNAVATELGMSERQFRRVFREAMGMSPKAFAKLARFRSALTASQNNREASWASIAVGCGYYDQAHLIDEFRAIAGVTPRALIHELER